MRMLLEISQLYGDASHFSEIQLSVPRRFVDNLTDKMNAKERLIAQLTLGIPLSGHLAESLRSQPQDYLVISEDRNHALSISFNSSYQAAIQVLAQTMMALQAVEKAA